MVGLFRPQCAAVIIYTLCCVVPIALLSGGATAETPPKQPILDGRTVSEGEYPYVAKLMYRGTLLCSGTLVSSRHVLTAAHCFYNERNTRGVGDTDVVVRLNGEEIRSKSITINPTYRPRSQACAEKEHDAALVELSSTPRASQVIPLLESPVPVGALVTLVGYGSEGSGGSGESGSLPPDGFVNYGITLVEGFGVEPSSPNAASDYYFWRFDSGESNTGSGDSGGPAFYDVGTERYLSGITCGGDDDAQFGTYSFNTRADILVSWVRSVTGEVPSGTPPSFGTLGTHTAPRGREFSLPLPVSGSDPLQVTASGLPPGLSVNGRSITGIPQVVGTYTGEITAQNDFGTQTSRIGLIVPSFTPRVRITAAKVQFDPWESNDTLEVQGDLTVGSRFNPRGGRAVVTIGRYTIAFRLGKDGKTSPRGRSYLNLKGTLRRGVFTSSTVPFILTLSKVALFDTLSTLGFVNSIEAFDGQEVALPVSVVVNDIEASATVIVRFSKRTQRWSFSR